jgi:anti-sigma-K factor RskA
MASMTHDELRELTGGYALGALSEPERLAVEAHLPTCPACADEVRALTEVSSGLAYAVPQHDPPAALRARVLKAAVGGDQAARGDSGEVDRIAEPKRRSPSSLPAWFALAASIAAVAIGLYSVTLRQRIVDLEGRLREAMGMVARMREDVKVAQAVADKSRQANEVLRAADVRRIDLAGQKDAPNASGRAFWSPSRGLVVAASNMPPLAPGQQYELWVIPPGQGSKPIAAGMIDLESDGGFFVLANAGTSSDVGTVAVTPEPAGGLPQPSGPITLAGAVH